MIFCGLLTRSPIRSMRAVVGYLWCALQTMAIIFLTVPIYVDTFIILFSQIGKRVKAVSRAYSPPGRVASGEPAAAMSRTRS